MQLLPGEVIKLGWNGAKLLGDENLAYEQVRVEAAGADWVVVRSEAGKSRAATFAPYAPLISHALILKELKE
tara:strand:+ start:2503 stop:2718 length:216 start_codon:yes stop_codon:yes gene_type:complete